MKFCENCGFKLPDEAKFCGKCGTRQSVIISPTQNPLQESLGQNNFISSDTSSENEFQPASLSVEEKTPEAQSATSEESFDDKGESVTESYDLGTVNELAGEAKSEADTEYVQELNTCNYETADSEDFQKNENETVPKNDEIEYIKCPYCCEKIIKGARLCRYCHSNLVDEPKPAITSVQSIGGAAVKTVGSFNWSILLCAASLICQAVIIILALTDLLTVGFELSYGGYSYYKSDYSLGLSIFSCFDIGDLISKLQTISSFNGDGLKTGLTTFGVCLLGLIGAYLIQLIYRIYTLYKDSEWLCQHKKRFGFDGYSVTLPVAFVVFAIIALMSLDSSLGDVGISDAVNISLSPSVIAIIVIICVQIAINTIAKKYETEQEIKYKITNHETEQKNKTVNQVITKLSSVQKEIENENSNIATWKCPDCCTANNMRDKRCRVCGLSLQEAEEQGYWICQGCGVPNDLNVEYCIHCKRARYDYLAHRFNFPL